MTDTPDDVVSDELDFLAAHVTLAQARIVELGCGKAELSRRLVQRFADAHVDALEVDATQHAANVAAPAARLHFIAAGAQAIPLPDASRDGAIMLKSLHHVPVLLMDQALAEAARVLRPGGWLYVSEPVYDGVYNDIIKIFNDEREVRAQAYAAVHRAVAAGRYTLEFERIISMPVVFKDFDEFLRKTVYVSFAERDLSPEMLADVKAAFMPHLGPQGARFIRPVRVQLLHTHA